MINRRGLWTLMVVLVAGCTPRTGAARPPAPASRAPPGAGVAACTAGSVSLSVTPTPAALTLGQTLTAAVLLRDTGPGPCSLPAPFGPVVSLSRAGGAFVWGSPVTWTTTGSTLTVRPGAPLRGTTTWGGLVADFPTRTPVRVGPGTFQLTADFGLPSFSSSIRAPVATVTVAATDGRPADVLCPQYCYQAVLGNFDGQSPDEVFAEYTTKPLQPRQPDSSLWRARLTVAGGPLLDIDLSRFLGGGALAPDVRGLADAIGDGRDELFLEVDSGASTEQVGIFALVGSTLTPVRIVGGHAGDPVATLPVLGSAGHNAGIACTVGPKGEHQLVSVGWATPAGATPVPWVQTTYLWRGLTLIPASTISGIADGGDAFTAQDPHVQAANAGLQC